MTKFILAILLSLITTSAFAQQTLFTYQELQSIVSVIQGQRNQAMDAAAVGEAKLTIANQKIKELQKQIDDSKEKK